MAITVNSMGLSSVQLPGRVEVDPGPAGGLTLRSLICDHLAPRYDTSLTDTLLDAQGQLKPEFAILVNGRNVMSLGGMDLYIKDGATVLITAVVSGG